MLSHNKPSAEYGNELRFSRTVVFRDIGCATSTSTSTVHNVLIQFLKQVVVEQQVDRAADLDERRRPDLLRQVFGLRGNDEKSSDFETEWTVWNPDCIGNCLRYQ